MGPATTTSARGGRAADRVEGMSHHAHAVHAQDPTLANRYGTDQDRPSRRRLWVGLGVLGLLGAVLLAVWIGLNLSVGNIEHKDVGYTIEDDGNATVTFQVLVPEGVQAECDVLVMDSHAAPVGFRTVRLVSVPQDQRDTPSDAQQVYTVDVRTVVRGDSGVVEACRKL